jgi:hypothetical protein
MKWTACIFNGLFISQSAYPQVSSGTVIVFQLVNGKFIMAADSRGIFKGVPDDTYCKIAAFRQQVIFAASGGPLYAPGTLDFAPAWNAFEDTSTAVAVNATGHQDSVTLVMSIADTWAINMRTNWLTLNFHHPDFVRSYCTTLRKTIMKQAI